MGGTEYYNVMLATELKKRGFDVRLFIGERTRRSSYLNILRENNIFYMESEKFHTDYSDRSIENEFIFNVLDYFENWTPDIIHASPAGKLIVAFLENKNHPDIPIVATEYTTPSSETAHWYPTDLKKYVNQIDAFVATCKASAKGIRDFHKYENDIYIIRHFIKGPKIVKKGQIKNSVGCVARLSAEKGIDFLLGAWKYVVRSVPDASLHIYGHGPDENHLKDMVKALGILESVRFWGTFEPKVGIGAIVGRHKIFVQPSLFESIPTSLIELMGCGRAIIASDVGGIKELINKNTGVLLQSASTDKLADAIVKVLQNTELQDKYSKNAKSLFDNNYSLTKNINKMIALYKMIISKYRKIRISKQLYCFLNGTNIMTKEEIQLLLETISGNVPKSFDFDTKYAFYKFFELVILPEVLSISPITLSGYHGIEHTKMVGRFCLDLSIALNQNPIPSLFAAALHDCARTNNYYDEEHGPNAVPVAKKLFEKDVALLLSKKEQEQIIYAIKNHTVGTNAKDVISAILWDSDRIRLSWDRGYKSEFFSTEIGKKIASLSIKERKYIFLQHKKLCDRLIKE